MKFPYGICDFYQIITENYFYIDRTDRIRLIENTGKQLLFLRPRRFGKSLLLSMLENYYDVARAGQFETLFGSLAIGQNPTPLRNQYFVMKWDFSTVDPQGDVHQLKQTLHDHINIAIQNFARYYQGFLQDEVNLNPTNAIASFQSLLGVVRQTPYRLYLLIDEYDNFANEALMSQQAGERRYQDLLYGEGTLKTLFKAVKAAAAGAGLDRVFITGVSPIVLSDMTSGYNVAESVYLKPQFYDLCGFSEAEIEQTLKKIVQACQMPEERVAEAMLMMRSFYNGYCFSPGVETLLYNPTLALYFMKNFQETCRYPEQLLDRNLAMDRGKLAYISRIEGGGQLILDALNDASPLVIQRLEDRFGVEELLKTSKDTTFMASLLTYFGILTLAGQTVFRKTILKVPNQVVRGLYLEHIQEMLLLKSPHQAEIQSVAEALYGHGEMQPVCDFIESRYFKIFDNRDYRWSNELTIKTLFLTILYNDILYLIESELELDRTYADLILLRRPDVRQHALFDLLIEFKYVSLATASLDRDSARNLSLDELKALAPIQQSLAEAKAQLERYRQSLAQKYGQSLRLRQFAVVSVGFERLVWEAIEDP